MSSSEKLKIKSYHFFHDKQDDRHEIAILDSEFLNSEFEKDRSKAGVVLRGLTEEHLKELQLWLEKLQNQREFHLPGL